MVLLLSLVLWVSLTATETNGQAHRFVLNGVNYPNGSTVLRTDIGEGDAALQCITDRDDCCTGAGRAGEFYFPNGEQVPILGDDPSIRTYYRNRGTGFIRLNRRSVAMETGQFRCEIPDASGTNVTLFINIENQQTTTTTATVEANTTTATVKATTTDAIHTTELAEATTTSAEAITTTAEAITSDTIEATTTSAEATTTTAEDTTSDTIEATTTTADTITTTAEPTTTVSNDNDVNATEIAPNNEQTPTTVTQAGNCNSIDMTTDTVAIASAVAAVVIVLIIAITILAIVALCLRNRRHEFKPNEIPLSYEQSGLVLSNITHIRGENEPIEDHDYEILQSRKMTQSYEYIDRPRAPLPQRWSSPVGQFELTQCAAYTPTTHGNLQEEAELTQCVAYIPTTRGNQQEEAETAFDKKSTVAVASSEGQVRNMADS